MEKYIESFDNFLNEQKQKDTKVSSFDDVLSLLKTTNQIKFSKGIELSHQYKNEFEKYFNCSIEDYDEIMSFIMLHDKYFEFKPLDDIEILTLENKQIKNIPSSIKLLKNLVRIYSKQNLLTFIPKEIFELKELKHIDLSENLIETLPKEISKLTKLEYLTLKSNQIKILPKEIGKLKKIKNLDLSLNFLDVLPNEIGELKNLQYLYLTKNKLTNLPEEISNLIKLKELFLGSNDIKNLPNGLKLIEKLKIFVGKKTSDDFNNALKGFRNINYTNHSGV